MRILHLDLKTIKEDTVELRCFWDNPNDYADRALSLSAIADLTRNAEEVYYVSAKLRENLPAIGQRLFNWLDGSDRWLVSRLGEYPGEGIVLAIAVAGQLAHLPWEVLHDGVQFLVQRYPAVVPVRWLSSDQVPQLTPASQPYNGALRLLFMATSPQGIKPVLNYEQEEAAILKATARPTIGLTVEESGCLEELGYLVDSYGKNYFDVVHITGHATIQAGQPKFITETATGDAYYASAIEIARTLKAPLPPLLFLSGCKTGQAGNAGAVPSMAEQLLQAGATAVLGWGQNVLDTNATAAAAALYEALSRSNPLAEAVAFAYQKLIEQEARDWHLLRLYVGKTLPESFVTPRNSPGWKPAPPASMATEFLDPLTKQIKVPRRESFVGRRRQLQNCLRALTQSPESLGVLIHGMGGLGKSSLAARICDRLPQFNRLVWQGAIDGAKLARQLAAALDDRTLRERLLDPQEDLRFRLRGVFTKLNEQGASPFLLVLDDFEQNLEPQGMVYRLKSPAANVLQDLIWAIQDTYAPHRFILTSRYDFELTEGQVLYKQPMDAFQGADLQKKCERLSALKPPELEREESVTEALVLAAMELVQLQEQAKRLADGNPRLLETLNGLDQLQQQAQQLPDRSTRQELLKDEQKTRSAQPPIAPVKTLAQLEQDPTELRQQIVDDRLLHDMDSDLQAMLSRGLIFELPVPRSTFVTVTLPTPHSSPSNPLDRAIALGILEVSPDDTLRVPRILPLTLPAAVAPLFAPAAQSLYQQWWEGDYPISEEQSLEIVRLALLGQELEIAVTVGDRIATRWVNSSRFADARSLCQAILQLGEDYRILGTIARAEVVLGDTKDAIAHYEQALHLCPEDDFSEKAATLSNMAGVVAQQGDIERALQLWQESLEILERIGDVQGKAATLNNMALVVAQQGDIERALQLWQEDLEISERIGDVQGKAATLSNMAGVVAQQGDIERALQLWQESLEIKERIGDVKGKAATLANLAYWAGEHGDKPRQFKLNVQAAQNLAQVRAYGDLFTVLSNLGLTAAENPQSYLAQALWLGLRIQTPLPALITLARFFYDQVPQGDAMEALLATTALFFCQVRGEGHPQLNDLQNTSLQMLANAAVSQGVEVDSMETLSNWMQQQQLNDPHVFLPKLTQQLEAMIDNNWLFDPSGFQ